jgi:hypothetical protein
MILVCAVRDEVDGLRARTSLDEAPELPLHFYIIQQICNRVEVPIVLSANS